MAESSLTESPEPIEVAHTEFCRGLPAGHFRLIVNPDKARKYVRHRLFIIPVLLAVAGGGTALTLFGFTWLGLGLVALAVAVNRLVSVQSAKILLHLVTQDAGTYREAIDYEILEVRRAR
jgi:hypothetical protein